MNVFVYGQVPNIFQCKLEKYLQLKSIPKTIMELNTKHSLF